MRRITEVMQLLREIKAKYWVSLALVFSVIQNGTEVTTLYVISQGIGPNLMQLVVD